MMPPTFAAAAWMLFLCYWCCLLLAAARIHAFVPKDTQRNPSYNNCYWRYSSRAQGSSVSSGIVIKASRSGSNDNQDNENDSSSYNDPFANETPQERASRMEAVRKLQQSFYKDEESSVVVDSPLDNDLDAVNDGASEENKIVNDFNDFDQTNDQEESTTTIKNLPLWRVQWTELPGSQNVLNVHVPHYTNMFQKILKGRSKTWGGRNQQEQNDDDIDDKQDDNDDSNNYYFGHIYLPGGSENLDNPDYELQPGQIGTLMRVSDSRQQADGRLTLVVQALERFEITRVERSGFPYAIADVAILPDREQNSFFTERSMAVRAALDHHPFEYRRVSIEECQVTRDDGTVVGMQVSPLSNYDATKEPPKVWVDAYKNEQNDGNVNNRIIKDPSGRDILRAESDTWLALDTMLRLLQEATKNIDGFGGVPIPAQILGLLPRSKCSDLNYITSSNLHNITTFAFDTMPWPEDFFLESFVSKLEDDESATVGTYSKSPFVRVVASLESENDENNDDEHPYHSTHQKGDYFSGWDYSPLRRAQRFSYVIWFLMESIMNTGFSREVILATKSTEERLKLAQEKMQAISNVLRGGASSSSRQ